MNPLEELIRQFERFPGIGARQARRFAFHLLTESEVTRERLASLISTIGESVRECDSCSRFFPSKNDALLCPICADPMRDHTKMVIVERDSDIDAVERSSMYDGLYFVLGGTVPLLGGEESKRLRGGKLRYLVEKRVTEGLTEIILGFSINPDGENTGRYIISLLKDTLREKPIKISELGRGLSTGSELEYADPETIKNAFKNRT